METSIKGDAAAACAPPLLTFRQHELVDQITAYVADVFPSLPRCEIRDGYVWIPLERETALMIFVGLVLLNYGRLTFDNHPVFEHVFEYGTSISLEHPALTGEPKC